MKATIDASVIVKWFIPDREDHHDKALALLTSVEKEHTSLMQPLHWQAETIAVLTRLRPEMANKAIVFLDALEFPVVDTIDVYQKASLLSQTLDHHLFDTLYHAVAIIANTTLITDDRKYYNKAKAQGNIQLLSAV